jgi:nucleoside-diphosphate-sugar epimerase
LRGIEGSRVLVTGAAGFIGANLVRELIERDARVFALLRPAADRSRLVALGDRIDRVEADLEDAISVDRAVATAHPDFVIHAAAPAGHPRTLADRRRMLATALLGTENLVSSLAGTNVVRFVHTGSSTEYGPRNAPHVEDEEPAPRTPRGVAKLGATLLCRQRALSEGFPAVTLRIFSVYGPWESPVRLVPAAVRAALSGSELLLTEPGIRRDFVHVADVVEAILRAMTAEGVDGEIVNVGSGKETSNEELVSLLGEVVGRRIAVRPGAYPSQPSDVPHSRADIEKAARLLACVPRIPLREGLARTVEWWKSQGTRAP